MEALFSESAKTVKDITFEYGEPGSKSTGNTKREKSELISQPKKLVARTKNINRRVKIEDELEQPNIKEDLSIEELYKLMLNLHNKYRALHYDTPPLTLSQDCCRTAQIWADSGVYEHSKKGLTFVRIH